MNQQLKLAGLGSSFAAGIGIPNTLNVDAGRSDSNFIHLLAKKLGSKHVTDLSVSSATLAQVINEPQTRGKTTFVPQLDALPADVDIVTVLGGGNDMIYIGGMLNDTLRSTLVGKAISAIVATSHHHPHAPVSKEDVTQRLVTIIDTIHQKAPKAQIYLVEYLTLFGSHVQPGANNWLTDEQIKKHQAIAQSLSEAYRAAIALRPDAEHIPVAAKSWDHGIGSEDPWVEGFSIGGLIKKRTPYHPNRQGMIAVADMLFNEVQKNLSERSNEEGASKL